MSTNKRKWTIYYIFEPEDKPIEYHMRRDTDRRNVREHGWINLTQAGVWVNSQHLRPTDVRLTVLMDDEKFSVDRPASAAEKLAMMLLGITYEEDQ